MMRTYSAERLARMKLAALAEPLDRVVTPKIVGLEPQAACDLIEQDRGSAFQRCRARAEHFEAELLVRATEAMRARVLVPGDEEWPTALDELAVPPWCLWVRGKGHLDEIVARSVAIVGSRAASPYGTTVARGMAGDLADERVNVVSGAAYGIDVAAHEGALAAGAPTVAALACGLDRAYPAAHRGVLDRIRQDGVLVSEYPPGQAPMKYRFLARNRIIAALGAGTVVVEAGLRSGSLNTAGYAADLGRPVGAVPGAVTSATSAGSNELIRQGGQLVCDAAEVLEMIGPMDASASPLKRSPDTMLDVVSEVASRTREAFPASRPVTVDQLVHRAGLGIGEVLAGVGELQSLGVIEQAPAGGWRLTRTGR